jgi:tetratricopeptide (TPR) repeat protein
LEDEGECNEHIGRLADAYVEVGKMREAAMLLAGSAGPTALSERQYECDAYRLLGARMLEKGKLSQAIVALRGALQKESGDVRARVGLGVCLGMNGEYAQAVSEFQKVIDMPGTPVEQIAEALFNQGIAKGSLGDIPGEIADYTAVVDLHGAPTEQVARALVNRGLTKSILGDSAGAIADCTIAVHLPGAPGEEVARALFGRGAASAAGGDFNKALSDFQSAVDIPGISSELRAMGLLSSAVALQGLGRSGEAIARFEDCLRLRANSLSVYGAFAGIIGTHLRSGKSDEAARLMGRLHEFELAQTPTGQRLGPRVLAIRDAGKKHGPETAALLLDAALKNDPEDIRVHMEFLAPAIQYARTGDEQTLSRLPERERDMAKQIAAVIMGKKDRVEIGP